MTHKNKALKDFNGDVSAEVLDFIKKADRFKIERAESRRKRLEKERLLKK